MRSLELKREVRMRLEMGDGPLNGAATSNSTPKQSANGGDDSPIEITCTGPFEFDMQEYAASFHQQVDVFRLNPTGESDQLNCQLLTVHFGKPGEAPPAGTESTAASNVRLIEARGKPVTMRSPTQGIYARCLEGVDYVPGARGSRAAWSPMDRE